MKTALLLLCAALPAMAQTPPAFDAASIKPASPDNSPGVPYKVGPNGFSMRAFLVHLVQQAYDMEDYQVIGGPAWARSDWYDVQAKSAGDEPKDRIRMMLQTLLAERFQLKAHRETRMMQGYVLSVEKGGPKLPPAMSGLPPDHVQRVQMGGGEIWVRGGTMGRLATGLRLELGPPVIDETKIEGMYDIRLRFDEGNDQLGARPAGSPPISGSVFSALHELGLRLEAGKVPIEVLVIDSVSRPSEN